MNHKQFLISSYTDNEKRRSLEELLYWKNNRGDIATSYKNVNAKYIPKIYKPYNKIKIISLGWNNLCFQNSLNTCKYNDEYKMVGGYNITACPCGRKIGLEPHFVNYKIENGKKVYYDFTSDFDNEEYKYFVPNSDINSGCDLRKWKHFNKGCKCNINWN